MTGGAGGFGGSGDGDSGGVGGIGGNGGGFGDIGDGDDNIAGAGGAGGQGGSANGTGGSGGSGGTATGGSTGAISIDVAGNIIGGTVITLDGGQAYGGYGSSGGNGSASTAGAGGAGGNGGNANGTGGSGGAGGDAFGGDTGPITITVGGIDGITITTSGGDGTGGDGGYGGIGAGGTAGAGGGGGVGGGIGSVTDGSRNIAGAGGDGGAGGSANGSGGDGGDGGAGTGGNVDPISISLTGDSTGSIVITASGGDALGGAGGAGGDGTGGIAGSGGAGGAGGAGQLGGDGGNGGDAGDGGDATAGDGGEGGDALGGSATVNVTNGGTIISQANAIVITAVAGSATGGNAGIAGDADAGNGGIGGAGGAGAASGGTGGDGGAGGDGGDATSGNSFGGDGTSGEVQVTVLNTGAIQADIDGIVITTTTGSATGGDATGGTANGGDNALGGAAGAGDGGAGTQGGAGDGGGAIGGTVTGGSATSGSASILVDNRNLLTAGNFAVNATANGAFSTILVDNSGTLSGGAKGVVLTTRDVGDSDIDIVNSGLLTATSLFAIDAKGASTEILNSGTVLGFIDLTDEGDTFDNLSGGFFEARGTSDFRDGDDVVNNAGTVHTANEPGVIENVSFINLELFNNSGWISLIDGQAGDSFTLGSPTEYLGFGGKLAVDAFLAPGPDGLSDTLVIDASGTTDGDTTLHVNLTNPIGSSPNFVGIPVVIVNGGATNEEDFNLAGGVLNAGFFAWDLRLDVEAHELITIGLGAGSFEFAAGITGAQDIWYQTTGLLLQRQADLRPTLEGTQVTPVADFAEPVEPTPVNHVTPGFWLKGVGAWLERDQDEANNVETDRDQEIYGIFAGFDFGTENLADQGDVLLFGLLGGYIYSELDFDQTGTEWQYEGPSVGVYATYLNHAFFADLIVKADFLDVDIDASGLAPAGDTDTDVFNLGGRLDTGYKVPFGQGLFVEPQASLAVVYTEVDDIDDIFGGSVDFDDETSVRGRLGLRLGHEFTASNAIVYSSDVTVSVWQEFAGDNDVTIFAPLTPATGVSDDPGETFGDVSLGFSMLAPEGWSGFLRGNYTFNDDFDAFSGNAGLRYAW